MTAGNIGAWQKKPGDTLAPGDVLVEIETDKAQMDFEFQEDGVLAKVLKESGEKDVPVGNVRHTKDIGLHIHADNSVAHCCPSRGRYRYRGVRIVHTRGCWWGESTSERSTKGGSIGVLRGAGFW